MRRTNQCEGCEKANRPCQYRSRSSRSCSHYVRRGHVVTKKKEVEEVRYDQWFNRYKKPKDKK